MFNVFKQDVFQGRLSRRNYFEGWYFKHVSSGLEYVYSFIPGISLSEENPHAFIQVIDGITGQSYYIQYDLNDFSWDNKKLYIKIGNSYFTAKGIYIDIKDGSVNFKGKIDYKNIVQYPSSILSPGIMGWYSYVPHMECNHHIISLTHELYGNIEASGKAADFTGGKGYIEKDWGTSFPREWLWVHSNTFANSSASMTFSAANIPWRHSFFMGFIAFLYTGKNIYTFATYNKSRITKLFRDDTVIYISAENTHYKIDITVCTKKTGQLMAPVNGNMIRKIHESIDSEIEVKLYDSQGNIIFDDSAKRAGLEIEEKIFEYFR